MTSFYAKSQARAKKDNYSISLNDNDFAEGDLKTPSNIRPNRLFTADKSIILYKTG